MFLGLLETVRQTRGRLSLPIPFARGIGTDEFGYRPVLLSPGVDGCVSLYPLAQVSAFRWLSGHRTIWQGDYLQAAGDGGRLHSEPVWCLSNRTPQVDAVASDLATELATSRRLRPRGRALEELVARVLESHRFSIEQRVRVAGAEADLIALSRRVDGQLRFTLIECKDYGTGPVGISEVMRLHGFRDALKTTVGSADALLVTTSNASSSALRFARTKAISVVSPLELREWATAHSDVASAEPPLFSLRSVDVGGRVALAREIWLWLRIGVGARVVLTGNVNCLELWHPDEWSRVDSAGALALLGGGPELANLDRGI